MEECAPLEFAFSAVEARIYAFAKENKLCDNCRLAKGHWCCPCKAAQDALK